MDDQLDPCEHRRRGKLLPFCSLYSLYVSSAKCLSCDKSPPTSLDVTPPDLDPLDLCVHRSDKPVTRSRCACVYQCEHPQRGGTCTWRECAACGLWE